MKTFKPFYQKITAILLLVVLLFGNGVFACAAAEEPEAGEKIAEETAEGSQQEAADADNALTTTKADNSSKTTPETTENGTGTTNKETAQVRLSAPSAILMESENGTVIFEQNADDRRPVASITKIMTLLLIFEALDAGQISLNDTVTVSEHAASMGGSQVFFEPYETQTVETMIKCITIASANDACVAMAEHLAGSEEAFVAKMNEKAKSLNMTQTTFVNCCGLDVSGHLSSARDVALMSCELMKHPKIKDYTTIWMDTIVHTTKRGSSEFGLANTNKLIKQYNGITGLKTGSTGEAKFCLSATAERNGVKLVAVVLAAPDPKARFREAAALLDYGFANCMSYTDDHADFLKTEVSVTQGMDTNVEVRPLAPFYYIFTSKADVSKITTEIELPESIAAPVEQGAPVGRILYRYNGKDIGSVALIAAASVEKMTFGSAVQKGIRLYFRGKDAKEEETR